MDSDKRNAWLRKLDEECPYQVVLPRQPFGVDDELIEKFDMYVEDEFAALAQLEQFGCGFGDFPWRGMNQINRLDGAGS